MNYYANDTSGQGPRHRCGGRNELLSRGSSGLGTGLGERPAGDGYVSDGDNRIRKINLLSGIITTVAGVGGPVGFSGDMGPATAAQLYGPQGICVDQAGNLFIADYYNNRVRKVDYTTQIITTFAGRNLATYNGEGIPATDAQLSPYDLKFDLLGNLIIADMGNNRVRKITAANYIYTIAGDGSDGFGGDSGPATSAQIDDPQGVAVDLCGQLFIADELNNRIRKVTYPPILTTPTISLTSPTSSAPPGTSVTINATVSNAGSSYIIYWLNKGVEFTTTTVPSVTYIKAAGTDTITARVVSTATYGCYDSTTSSGWVVSASGVGLSAGLKMTGMEVWPNPLNNELHLDDVAETSTFHIYSMVGTLMLNGVLKTGSNVVEVRELPAGMYVVEVAGRDGWRVVKRIIKQ